MKIGVLALQGAFIEHKQVLEKLKADVIEIRNKEDLTQPLAGLILPGGESTVIIKLLTDLDMISSIKTKICDGIPVFGTCAGLILLAKEVDGKPGILGTMDISVARNAYGRQSGSFNHQGRFADVPVLEMTFIRAPAIERAGVSVATLALANGNIVAVKQGNQLACTFHPELDTNHAIHQYFLKIVNNYLTSKKQEAAS